MKVSVTLHVNQVYERGTTRREICANVRIFNHDQYKSYTCYNIHVCSDGVTYTLIALINK